MNALSFDDHKLALPILQELVDRVSFRIVVSIIGAAKNVTQIALENELPLSSTYKKIRRLQTMGVISIERIDIDDCGKKVLYYRSRIKSLEFNVTQDKVLLQFEKNDHCSIRRNNVFETTD
jgi:predicted transcriptional regulator